MINAADIEQTTRRGVQDRVEVILKPLPVSVKFLRCQQAFVELVGNVLFVQVRTDKNNLLTPILEFGRGKIFAQDAFVLYDILLQYLFHALLRDTAPPLASRGNAKVLARVTPVVGRVVPPRIFVGAVPFGGCEPTKSLAANHADKRTVLEPLPVHIVSLRRCFLEQLNVQRVFHRYWPLD
jgi:hypothetical protein